MAPREMAQQISMLSKALMAQLIPENHTVGGGDRTGSLNLFSDHM